MIKGKSEKIKISKSQRDLLAHLGPITLKNQWSIFKTHVITCDGWRDGEMANIQILFTGPRALPRAGPLEAISTSQPRLAACWAILTKGLLND